MNLRFLIDAAWVVSVTLTGCKAHRAICHGGKPLKAGGGAAVSGSRYNLQIPDYECLSCLR